MAKNKKTFKIPDLGWFTKNYSVFELVVKTILFIGVIPYASIFLNGLVFDRWLNVYAKSVASPIIIVSVAGLLLLAGLIISVFAIIRYIKFGPAAAKAKKAVGAPAPETKSDNTDNPT